jgi:hypothetical protein
MKKKLLRLTAVSVMALSVSTGVAAANSGSIDGTGRDSTNKVTFADRSEQRVRNNADANLEHNNVQNSTSGDARVHNNETGGDALSGGVTSDSLVSAKANVNNSASSAAAFANGAAADHTGTVSNTGQDSYNSVSFRSHDSVKVSNNTSVNMTNNSTQNTASGKASVTNNTNGGGATSGTVTSLNTTELDLTVTN